MVNFIENVNEIATQEMSAAVEEVSAQADEVVNAAQSMDGMARSLQEVVNSFKLDGKARQSMVSGLQLDKAA
jgi:methyl-accepting chemotaxis protein